MIYIVTLLAILVCVVVFDFGRMNNPRFKKICYVSIFIWLTALAGFSYNVGSDIPGYMRQYAEIGRHHFETWKDFAYFENRQPGWMLLNILCSGISKRFVLLMVVIAVFANCIVFKYIKKHTKYVFLGILLYYVCSYLNWNFNSLRQTVAIAFFLLGYDYLVDKKWIKYYTCCFGAFMFHSTAAVCFIFPLFYLIKVNYKTVGILVLGILSIIILMLGLGGADMISEWFLNNAEFAGMFTDREEIVEAYFGENSMKYEGLNLFGMIQMVIFVIPIILTIIGGHKQIITIPTIALPLLLFYLSLYMLDFVIPVVFMRLVMYIDVLFYCALSDMALHYSKKRFIPRNIFAIVLLCVALFRPIHTLFAVNPASNLAFYKQFYPYYSVFDPKIDPVRSANFGSYREY